MSDANEEKSKDHTTEKDKPTYVNKDVCHIATLEREWSPVQHTVRLVLKEIDHSRA